MITAYPHVPYVRSFCCFQFPTTPRNFTRSPTSPTHAASHLASHTYAYSTIILWLLLSFSRIVYLRPPLRSHVRLAGTSLAHTPFFVLADLLFLPLALINPGLARLAPFPSQIDQPFLFLTAGAHFLSTHPTISACIHVALTQEAVWTPCLEPLASSPTILRGTGHSS